MGKCLHGYFDVNQLIDIIQVTLNKNLKWWLFKAAAKKLPFEATFPIAIVASLFFQ